MDPFNKLCDEILHQILAVHAAEDLIRKVHNEDFTTLRLVNRRFERILKPTCKLMAQRFKDGRYWKGYINGIVRVIKQTRAHLDLSYLFPDLSPLSNPLVPAHALLRHLSETDQTTLIRIWAQNLTFTETLNPEPEFLFGEDGIAHSYLYWTPPPTDCEPFDQVLILKDPCVKFKPADERVDCVVPYAVGMRKRDVLLIYVEEEEWIYDTL
ncbi:hypothetical protein HDV00_000347 [Rhizophlyctis rosea]|nr:hypothetical protein HDV00_000347 [Rhizophlyctis rosea]